MTWLNGFARGLGAVALSIALVVGAGTMRTAGANQPDGRIVALAYDPGTDTLVKAYAGALYRSGDGGQSWRKIALAPLEDGRIASITASPASKGAIYVAGPAVGVLRTDDGGKIWVERNEGLPNHNVIAVAAHTTQPETVYVVVSNNGVMDRGTQGGIRQLIHSDLAGSMQTGWLFAATPKGIRRVMDCFCLWQDAGELGSEAFSVTYDPRQAEHIYAATEKGLFRSTDGGENWVQTTSPGSKVVAVAFARSGILFAANEDGTLFRSADDGSTWNQVHA